MITNSTRIIMWVLVVACMVAIFSFSNQPAKESNVTSESFTYRLMSIVPAFRAMSEEAKIDFLKDNSKIFRKCAHFTIYATLGALLYLLLAIGYKVKKPHIIAPCIAGGYAALDEIHQLFISGRSGQFSDVILDFCGAVFGMLIVWAVLEAMKKTFRTSD